jgi:signal transduction histidine kinase/HAMP domain-containing protein
VRFTRLSHQILAVFVAVVVLALALSGWALTRLAQRTVADNVAQGHQQLARRIAEEIDLELDDIRPILSLLTESDLVRAMEPSGAAAELARYQNRFPAIDAAYVADATGQQIARTDGQPLEDVATTYGFQVAREGYELLSDVYLSPEGRGPMLTVYLPINRQAEVVGVLVADVSFARVQDILEGLALTRSETVVVFAANGRAVAHSRMAELDQAPALTDPSLIETLVEGPPGVTEGYTDELGRTVVGVHAPVDELGWGVVIQTPVGELASEVATLRRTMALALLGGVALAVLAGWLMANQLTEPIRELARAAERIAGGQLALDVDVEREDEIGVLAQAFGTMTDRLRVLIRQLEQRLAERQEAEASLRQTAGEMTALNSLSQRVSANLSLDQVVASAIDGVVDTTHPDLALLYLREGDRLLLQGVGPEDPEFYHEETPVHLVGECLCGSSVSEETSLYATDIHSDPRCTWEECKQAGLRSFAALPLRGGDEIIGVLGLASATERDFEERASFLETLANNVAVGVQNALLYEQVRQYSAELEQRVAERTAELEAANREIRQRAEELAALYEVGRSLAVTLDLDALLPTIAKRVTTTLEADRSALFLFDPRAGALRVQAVHGYMAERLADFSYQPGEEVVGQAYATGQTQYVPDLDQASHLPRRDEIRTVLAVPLATPTAASALGVLSVTSLRPRAFSPDQRQLIETMAGQIARAIRNAQLYEAAQEADRLKSAFLATMSHELRTPLNSIIGFIGILLQGLAGPLNDEQAKQLRMAQGSARHLLDLINDVLDISKIEAGQVKIVSEPFDVPQAIESVVRAVTPLAEKKGLHLVADVAPEVGQIVSDRRRVEQVLINLLNNAVKFTEQGEVRVACGVDDGWLVTRVSDTGIGIKPEDEDKLFEPFRQIDVGITRRYEGTGLGLSICKRLVETLGGEIWAESEWGVGSTFTFTLPLE